MFYTLHKTDKGAVFTTDTGVRYSIFLTELPGGLPKPAGIRVVEFSFEQMLVERKVMNDRKVFLTLLKYITDTMVRGDVDGFFFVVEEDDFKPTHLRIFKKLEQFYQSHYSEPAAFQVEFKQLGTSDIGIVLWQGSPAAAVLRQWFAEL
jgi:hypothetical protein